MAISDDELVAICTHEIEGASGYTAGELARDRADAMDYYLGEPYGDEVEGRSQVMTRETYETIESILPSLCRIFCDVDNMVEFDAVGSDDEDQAAQETDRVNDAYWKDNEGFYNTYTFCKDALLSKTGNLKVWWDETEQDEREEYNGLNEIEFGELVEDESVEREIIKYEETDEGINVVFHTTRGGKLCIEPVTPEEFGVRRDSRTPYARDLQFCYHRARKTFSELVASGYDRDKIRSIPDGDDVETEERLARRHLDDESDILQYGSHESTRTYWVTECYIHVDRDEDGISELLKVTLAAGANTSTGSAVLLDVEEVDAIPFFTAPANILTHKFYGLSIADAVMDIQHIKSTILRQILDNNYITNNTENAINERVNVDDMLTSRPGGVKRVDGTGPVGDSIMPLLKQPLSPNTFGLLEYLDEIRKDRTGSGDQVPALDAKSLANVNTGVAAIAYDAARSRVELIARILAEVGFKPLFRYIHEILQKNQSKTEVVKLRGKWTEVTPSEWRQRNNMTVKVGLGIASRERELIALDAIAERQAQIVQGGGFGILLMPEHIYNQVHDHTRALGMDPGRYYQDPSELPPQQPEGPSIQDEATMMVARAQFMSAQSQLQKNQVEAAKAQAQVRIAQMEQAEKLRQQEVDRETAALKAQIEELKSQRDTADKNADRRIEAEIRLRDQSIQVLEANMKSASENDKQQIDLLKAFLQSGTQLTVEQMKLMDGGVSGLSEAVRQEATDNVMAIVDQLKAEHAQELAAMRAEMMEAKELADAPKEILRDANGLISSIGGKRVNRDASGMALSVG